MVGCMRANWAGVVVQSAFATALLWGLGGLFGCAKEQALGGPRESNSGEQDAAHANPGRSSDAGTDLTDTDRSSSTEQSSGTESTADTSSTNSPDLPPIVFSECDTVTGETAAPEGPRAECATAPVALFHGDPIRGNIELFIKKLPAADPARRRGTLWLLQGGPGISGASLDQLGVSLHGELPDLDIVIPDHRGVGRSTFFECNMVTAFSTAEFFRACASELVSEWGDRTHAFNVTEAAGDVLQLAKQLRQTSDEQVLVWGGSYGGAWVHRVLQLDNTHVVTGAVIDSGGVYSRERAVKDKMLERDAAGDVLFAECAANAECRERLGDSPKERALAIMDDLCEPLNDEEHGRQWLQESLSAALDHWRGLRLVPAILYRAARCSAADVSFIEKFFALAGDYDAPPVYAEVKDSDAVLLHIMASEMMPNPTPLADLEQAAAEAVFANLTVYSQFDGVHDFWPVYPVDEYMGEFAAVETPTLILQGGLDSRTPAHMGRALAEHFKAASHQYFYFPLGTHGVYYGSHDAFPQPTTDTQGQADAGAIADAQIAAEPDRLSCGAHLTLQFLKDPTRPVDATCLDETPPLEFTAPDEFLESIAGHTDVWDNPAE